MSKVQRSPLNGNYHMSADRSEDFRSNEWITALRDYAQRLLAWFSADLSRLSGIGLELQDSERLTLMVQETDLQAKRQASCAATGVMRWKMRRKQPTAKRMEVSPRPVEDLKMLGDWLVNGSEPLLLLAPFGSGKSVLLATFACRLAEAVVRWCNNQGDGPLPPVPMPVRLREWKWYEEERLRDYVYSRGQNLLDPIGAAALTADQVGRLASADKLLPLMDLMNWRMRTRGVGCNAGSNKTICAEC